MLTDTAQIQCPYCGEAVVIVIDCSLEQQSYIEDCQVCCKPIELSVTVTGDEVAVYAKRDDE
jgi:transcription elongation factor Elf1